VSPNRYIGFWEEPDSDRIALPFTVDSAKQVLEWGADPSRAPVTHHDIAHWCDRFWRKFIDVDAAPEIERVLQVLADVDCQWDLYLANTYSLEQLRGLDLDKVCLPCEWFTDWLQALQGDNPEEAG
jgi:hypothetical protein